MALPNTPPFSLSDIAAEVGLGPGSDAIQCLNASYLSDKSLPCGMDRFLGYVHSTVPGVPENFGVFVAHNIPQIRLTWNTPSTGGEVATYTLERNVNGGGFVFLNSLPGFLEGYDDSDVVGGNSYSYRIRSKNGSGESAFVTSATVTVILAPAIPASITATPNGNRIEIIWEDGVGGGAPTNFRIEESFESGAYTFLADVAASGANSYLTGEKASGSYLIRIRAENEAGVSAYIVADFPINF